MLLIVFISLSGSRSIGWGDIVTVVLAFKVLSCLVPVPRSDAQNPPASQLAPGIPARTIPDIIIRNLHALARGAPDALDAYLHSLHREIPMDDAPRVSLHCHVLQVDGNGRPRANDLIEVICRSTLEYAIPRSRIRQAEDYRAQHNSNSQVVKLGREADDLFTTLVQSGEGGELLLFCIAEHILRLPQVLCKMDLKTSAEMHYHGADGVHCGVDPQTGMLAVYWAESKIYANATRAITACLESVAKLLRDAGGGDASRDFQLLQRYLDLADPALEAAVRRFLDKDDPAYLQLQFRGLCLVAFDCDAYGDPEQPCIPTVLHEAATALVPRWKSHIASRIDAERLSGFGIEMVCVPFPNARAFRRRFREELNMPPEPDDPEDEEESSAEPSSAAQNDPPAAQVRGDGRRAARGGTGTPPPKGSKGQARRREGETQ